MSAGKNVISLGEKHIHEGTKALSPEIYKATGYETGVFAVTEKTPKDITIACAVVDQECTNAARVFESRIIAVIDEKSERININSLSPEVRNILSFANQSIKLCLVHLLELIADGEVEKAPKSEK